MSTNKPSPDGHRVGAVKDRSQLQIEINGEEHWTKRDKTTGQFMDRKADEEKFKGVRNRTEGGCTPSFEQGLGAIRALPLRS
jgi:hypothetical protein